MKKFRNIIVATLTAAVAATSIGIAAYAVTPRNQLVGNYCAFEWGAGYAKTTNTTPNTRLTYASVEVYKDVTGTYVTTVSDSQIVGYNGAAYANAKSYSSNGYNFKCTGGIYGNASFHSPVVEDFSEFAD